MTLHLKRPGGIGCIICHHNPIFHQTQLGTEWTDDEEIYRGSIVRCVDNWDGQIPKTQTDIQIMCDQIMKAIQDYQAKTGARVKFISTSWVHPNFARNMEEIGNLEFTFYEETVRRPG